MLNRLVCSVVRSTASGAMLSCRAINPPFLARVTSSIYCRKLSSEPQPGLQHFKVPPLSQTLDKFLKSVKPLLSSEQYQLAIQLVEQFGIKGAKLQTSLEKRAQNTVNWLEDWWLNIAYLEYRVPVAIHVNPGILTPRLPFEGKDEQLRYAANLVSRILDYKRMIDSDSIPVEKLRGKELCMRQYYRILGCCRVPDDRRDVVVMHPGGTSNSPRHIVVMHNGHIFSLDVYNSVGEPLTSGDIYEHLQNIVKQSSLRCADPVGILTTEHRDKWAQIYQQLSQDAGNRSHLLEIQSSIIVLALDNTSSPTTSSGTADIDTVHLNEMNHGGGSHANSANRWFDKVLQAIVSPEGRIGFNYEHSAAEGPPIVHLIEACWANLSAELASKSTPTDKPIEPRPLNFRITSAVHMAIVDASIAFDTLVNDLNLIYLTFEKFGKDDIKAYGLSPDAFIQIALQLANYRVPTYESGSLRMFRHGRTETIRSCSSASDSFCRAMFEDNVPIGERRRLLRLAVNAHSKYTEEVTSGNGIDRHLLGLKLIAQDNQLPLPELLTDPVYLDTCYWKMSTSQVPSRTGSLLCFAPVVPDGYGVCYNPMELQVIFAISSWKSCPTTSAQRFAESLEQSMNDAFQLLCSEHTTSKL